MPLSLPCVLMRWSGTFGKPESPVERWSWSLKTKTLFIGTDQAQWDLEAKALGDLWVTRLAPETHADITLTETRIAGLNEAGRTIVRPDGSLDQGIARHASKGTNGGTTRHSPQTALVASLVTKRAGATGKGRAFLPAPPYGLDTDYRLQVFHAESYAVAMARLIGDLNTRHGAAPGDDNGRVSVFSSKGYSTPVTAVRVGRVLDTQRSRRTDVIEGYTQFAVP